MDHFAGHGSAATVSVPSRRCERRCRGHSVYSAVQPTTVTFGQSPTLVLGEGGIAFATNGKDTVNGPAVASFNIASGAVNWSYHAGAQSALSILSVNSDSSLAVNDSQSGVIQLDTAGNATQITGLLAGVPSYSWGGSWYVAGTQAAAELDLPMDPDPADLWATPNGNPSQDGGPDGLCPCLSQVFVTGNAIREHLHIHRVC